jgi:hypothetical protein
MAYKRIIYKGNPAKLEVFSKSHKLFKSLPVHKEAIKLGLRVPKLYSVKNKHGQIQKITEWIEGNTIYDEMLNNDSLIVTVCKDLARYINKLYDFGISPVDNHFKNFVWDNESVIYIDMKKLLYRDYSNHIVQMAKLCIKNCKTDRRKAIPFLREYSKYRDVSLILKECDRRNWKWFSLKMEPIKLEDVVNG